MQTEDTTIDLGQCWQGLKRRWLPTLLTFCGTAATISAIGLTQTPLYQAEGKLRFKGQDAVSTLTGLEDDDRGELKALNYQENPIETEIGIMLSVPVLEETIETLKLKDSEDELVSPTQFESGLTVNNEPGTDLLRVAYNSDDPAMAEAIVNTLMAAYLDQHLLENRAEARAAREFIEKQLPDARNRARQAEAKLRAFKEANQIVALEPETLSTVAALEDISDKITDVNSQLLDAQAQFNIFQARVGRDPQAALVATAVSQSAGVQALLQEYQAVQSTLAAERVRFQEQHPIVVDLKTKLLNLERLLDQRVGSITRSSGLSSVTNLQVGEVEAALVGDYVRLEARVNGLQQQEGALLAAQSAQSSRARTLPQLEQEQNELDRQLDAARSTYSLLLQRLQEVRVAENQNVGNVRVIQPASVLEYAVSPNKKLYVAAGVMLGTLLALSVAFLLETRDKSIKTVDQVRKLFPYPVLGVIPNFRRFTPSASSTHVAERMVPELVVDDRNTSPIGESFHMLRSNLKFLNSDRPPRAIVVTSSVSGEGKSTVASNLAASIAQTGKQVLLIDADLHRPTQHWVWNIPNARGLSDLLVGDTALRGSIQAVMPNLRVIPSGSMPPNPASLLDSQRMMQLLQAFLTRFDYVLFDTPPLSGGASASILGKMSDGVLLVVRPKVADITAVNYAKELIDRFHQNILGVVVNDTVDKYEPYSYLLSREFFDDEMVASSDRLDGVRPTEIAGRR